MTNFIKIEENSQFPKEKNFDTRVIFRADFNYATDYG